VTSTERLPSLASPHRTDTGVRSGDTRLDLCRTTTPSPMVPTSAFFRNSPLPLATILSRSDSSQNSHERVAPDCLQLNGGAGSHLRRILRPCLLRQRYNGVILAAWRPKSNNLAPPIERATTLVNSHRESRKDPACYRNRMTRRCAGIWSTAVCPAEANGEDFAQT